LSGMCMRSHLILLNHLLQLTTCIFTTHAKHTFVRFILCRHPHHRFRISKALSQFPHH
jgi:hypothetical protein